MSPSCDADRLPPGNTCAEGNELEVRTRWRRRIWFEGEMRRILVWWSATVVRWEEGHVPCAWSGFCSFILGFCTGGHVLFLEWWRRGHDW